VQLLFCASQAPPLFSHLKNRADCSICHRNGRPRLWIDARRHDDRSLGWPHPFKNGIAGRGWMEGFQKVPSRDQLAFTPEYFCRAVMASRSTVKDFFAKQGGR
jgi:hypothetical protein